MRGKSLWAKRKLYGAFYRSTLTVSIPFTVVIGGVAAAGGETQAGKVAVFLLVYATVGLAAAFWYKETVRRSEYLYYYNAGCTRWELWGICFAVSMLIWATVTLSVRIWGS